MSARRTIQLGTARAGPGKKAWGKLTVTEGRKSVNLPVFVLNGKTVGPHVFLIANQHGGEVNGLESLRRFASEIDPRKVAGTIFAVPSANPRAAMLMNECWPEDEDESLIQKYRGCPYIGPKGDRHNCKYNMNRKWPGKKGGFLVERMTYEIWNRAVMAPHAKAALVVDFHCHGTPSCIYAQSPMHIPLGVATGMPNVIFTRTAGILDRPYLSNVCRKNAIQDITVELGGQKILDPVSIEHGRKAIYNTLKLYGLLGGQPEYPARTLIMDPWRNDVEKKVKWPDRSHRQYFPRHGGLLLFKRRPFDLVKKGELIAEIIDPYCARIVEQCRAPMSGVLSAIRAATPACQKGKPIFDISMVSVVKAAEYLKKNPFVPFS